MGLEVVMCGSAFFNFESNQVIFFESNRVMIISFESNTSHVGFESNQNKIYIAKTYVKKYTLR